MDKVHSSWKPLFDLYNFDIDFIDEIAKESNSVYYPKKENIFRVFEMPVKYIKLVFLGQDPYHGPNQAHGLSFSVEKTVRAPPSLLNIFKELKQEFPERNYNFIHGSLEKWHEAGIFLLNSALTVEKSKPLSHMEIWSDFTDDVIKYIAESNKDCVFLLLGNFAKSKRVLVGDNKRCVDGVHPSPMAQGFIGSNVFKKVETVLGETIDWQN